jgi:hypothetical protein
MRHLTPGIVPQTGANCQGSVRRVAGAPTDAIAAPAAFRYEIPSLGA